MPLKLRNECADDPYYAVCARSNAECAGLITWEHALMYAGKQIQEKFAVIPLCYYHHLEDGICKTVNIVIALGRADECDKRNYPLLEWKRYGLKA